MKPVRLAILVIGVVTMACQGVSLQVPALQLPVHDLSLGSIPSDTTLELMFPVVNSGEAELVIDTVSTSCDCTVPGEVSFRVPPDSTVMLRISFHPVDTGRFRKNVILRANTDSVFHVIRFHGYARARLG